MIDLTEYTVALVALSPLALLLSIWAIEYAWNKLKLVGVYMLGSLALLIMGEP